MEVLSCSYDNNTGELKQFLIIGDDGQPDTKLASPTNLLLYDPEDELPFDGGMYDFMSGDSALRLSEDPYVAVGQAGDEYTYVLNIDGDAVETTREQADDLLRGVYDALVENDTAALQKLYDDIMSNQVRRPVVNALAKTYSEHQRLEIVQNGWLVDGFYLVDWNANMYASNDDPEEDDYVRSGSETVQKDTTYEMVRLSHSIDTDDRVDVTVNGTNYTLTEREMLFLSKITWLLNRRHYHPDTPFWEFANKWADVEDETPDLDSFEL